ncbi:MAG: 50S ribosomal protein L9 [Terrimicrobiaceae bacterium]|nr:50S ribosomal protein L9 [Terrimicrobiaceae bacterium]
MAHTEVILTTNIPSLGAEADIVKVRRGYARNFLVPRGHALEVTPGSLRRINHLKARRAEREAREMTAAEELAGKINKLKLTFLLETGETGKAFGSITAKDITERVLTELKLEELPKHAISLEKGIKETGDHEIPVKVHPDVTATLRIKVTAPEAPKSEDEAAEEGAKKPRRKTTKES